MRGEPTLCQRTLPWAMREKRLQLGWRNASEVSNLLGATGAITAINAWGGALDRTRTIARIDSEAVAETATHRAIEGQANARPSQGRSPPAGIRQLACRRPPASSDFERRTASKRS